MDTGAGSGFEEKEDVKQVSESIQEQRFTDPRYFAKNPFLEYAFITSAMMGQTLALSATTNVMSILRIMQSDFDVSSDAATWYVASVGLGLGTLILPSGSIGDKYGLKIAILGGYAWTLVWSLLCGFSYYVNSNFFVCCRTFQGCGLAFILPNILGAVGRIYKPGTLRKNMVFALIGLCAPLGGCLGTLFAGIIGTETPRWDWAFYSYSILCFVGMLLSLVSIPHIEPHRYNEVDWIGSVLGVGGLVLFNFAWNQAPVVGWDSPYIIVLLIIGVLLIPIFLVYELKFARAPLLGREILDNGVLLLTLACTFLGWGSFGIKTYQFFLFLLNFRHYTPVAAGAANCPAIVMGMVASITCGLLMKHKQNVRHVFLGSMLCFLAGDIILATCPVHETYWRSTFGLWLIAVFGMEWSFPGASIIMSDTLPPHLQGLAGSLVSTALNYGVSIFLGMAGTVSHQLTLQQNHPDPDLRAWRGAMYFSIGVSSLASVTGLVLWITLPRHHKREHELAEKEQLSDEISLP